MNSKNFDKWIRQKLLPNLPPHSVNIASKLTRVPSKYALKSEMIDWLLRRGAACDPGMRKQALYSMIEALRPREKTFQIDSILQSFGHTTIRLPPYMCDLNAIELAWAKMKRVIRDNNVTGDLSLKSLNNLTNVAVQSISADDWAGYEQHVIKIEDFYWEKDGVTSDIIDSIIINPGDDSDDTFEGDDDDKSDNDSDTSYSTNSELAQPL